MAGAFLFVRFFTGYTAAFPYDRVIDKPAGELVAELDQLSSAWWSKPANRRKAKAHSQKLKRELAQCRSFTVEEWNAGAVARPNGSRSMPSTDSWSPPPTEAPILTKAESAYWELNAVEGWFISSGIVLDWTRAISPRYAVALYQKPDTARSVAAALQTTLGELAEGTWEKTHWRDGDSLLAQANPRFFTLPEESLSVEESVVANQQMARIRGAAGTNPTRHEAWLRFFWPHIMPVLQLIDARVGESFHAELGHESNGVAPVEDSAILRKGKWTVGLGEAAYDGHKLEGLQTRHRKMLGVLVRAAGRPVSLTTLRQYVSAEASDPTNAIRSYISTIRKAIRRVRPAADPNPILNLDSDGYRLTLL